MGKCLDLGAELESDGLPRSGLGDGKDLLGGESCESAFYITRAIELSILRQLYCLSAKLVCFTEEGTHESKRSNFLGGVIFDYFFESQFGLLLFKHLWFSESDRQLCGKRNRQLTP